MLSDSVSLVSNHVVGVSIGWVFTIVALFCCLVVLAVKMDKGYQRMSEQEKKKSLDYCNGFEVVAITFIPILAFGIFSYGIFNGMTGYSDQVYRIDGVVRDASMTKCHKHGDRCTDDLIETVYMDNNSFTYTNDFSKAKDRIRPKDIIGKRIVADCHYFNDNNEDDIQEIINNCDSVQITTIEN